MLMPTDLDEILEKAQSSNVRFVELEYVDLHGILRNELLSLETFRSRKEGTFDASSVGLSVINWSDAVLKPDPETATIKGDVLRILCEIWEPFAGERSKKDPRYIAKLSEELLAKEGYKGFVGPEMEFMALDEDLQPVTSWSSMPKANYHVAPPSDPLYEFKLEAMRDLEEIGVRGEVTHHEVGMGQSEISIKADTPLRSADNVVRVKRSLKETGLKFGFIVTFMPKPVAGDNGSGMHIHMSLWDNERNLFYDPDDDYAELSQLGRYFIGGLIDHIESLTAIVAPTVNSYKRLVPGYEAPIYAVWSRANRSAAIRVPIYRKGASKSKRIEFRVPDPSTNPYLAFAATFAAGLDGVRRRIDPGDPTDIDVYSSKVRAKRLPRSLHEALDALESDNNYLREVFPLEVLDTYIAIKRKEASDIGSWPSDAEYKAYLNV